MKFTFFSSSAAAFALATALTFSPHDVSAQNASNPPQNPAAFPSSATPPTIQEGVTVMNGTAYSVHAGKPTPITQDLVLRVSPNGTITCFDGRTYALPQGVLMTLEARFAPVTSSNVPLPPVGNGAGNGNANESSATIVTPPIPVTVGSGAGLILTPGVAPSALPGFPQLHHKDEPANNVPQTPVNPADAAIIPSGNIPAPQRAIVYPDNSRPNPAANQQTIPSGNIPAPQPPAANPSTGK
jgi:hypothetical protein